MQRLKLSLLFLFVFVSSFARADQGNGCVYIAVNAAQRSVFAQFGFANGFQSGCLVVQQDTGIVYEWNGGSFSAVGGGGVGITTLNAQTGQTQVFANDTNVVITSSNNTHTLGWAGTLSMARGGSGKNITGKSGGIVYGATTTTMDMTAAGTSGQVLMSSGSSAPTWGTVDTSNFANKTLSNLTSPTSINQSLILDTDADWDLGTRAIAWNQLFIYSEFTTYNAVYVDKPNAVGSHVGGEFYSAAFNSVATNGGDYVFNSYDNGQGLTYGFNFTTAGSPKPIIFNTGTVHLTSALDLNSHQITNVTDPTLAQSAATKNYVDTQAGTIRSLNSQTGATQAFANDTNITITSSNNTHSLGWAGTLSLTRGGTGAALTAANGGIVYSTGSGLAILAAGTAGQALKSNGAGAPTWASCNVPVATMKEVEISSTFGGPATGSLTWDTRVLNTLTDPCSLITSLTSNVFTVTNAGTYHYHHVCPLGANVGLQKSRLYNVTGSAGATDTGGNQIVSSGGNDAVNANILSEVDADMTVTAGQQFRIEHAVTTHANNNDFGAAVSISSISETYCAATLQRIK